MKRIIKKSLNLTLSASFLIMCSCAGKPIYQVFVPNKPIQVIEVNEESSFFVQNNHLMNYQNFEDNYKERKLNWKTHFDEANYQESIQTGIVIYQFFSLGACLSTSYFPAVLAWCGSSIGSNYFVNKQAAKVAKERRVVVDEYNDLLEKTGDINKTIP